MTLNTLAFILLLAQIGSPGGQYPGQSPPGQYPPGQGGGGMPFPGRGRKTTTSEKKENAVTSVFFKGTVRELDAKSMVIEAEDSRIITVQIVDKTTKPKDLAIGDKVDVSAREDGKGGFLADSISTLDKPAVAAGAKPTAGKSEPGAEAEPPREPSAVILKGPKYDEDDAGPPTLKRGVPALRKKPAEPAPEREVADVVANPNGPPLVPAPSDPRQAFIEKAKDEAAGLLTGLPNYVCQEYTTRYVSEGKSDWHAVDVVSLDMVYQDGKEDYRNIAINGKPWKKPIEESGAWSTGEFGTILRDLFSPSTAATFKYSKDSTASGLPAHMYNFTVDRAHSHWRVTMVAQSIFPSYKGSIWLDKTGARPLRIEMQATQIPPDFPEDAVESAVDYGYVSLGTQKFFVPLKAEVLSCHRGMNTCDRNVIEFRNYHKYSGQSDIIFAK